MSLVPKKNLSSSYYLLIANLVPLFGVIFLGWDLFYILAAYWLENIVIGFFTILKILMAQKSMVRSPDSGQYQAAVAAIPALGVLEERSPIYVRIPIAIFFIIHFGVFTLVHGIFIFGLASEFGTGYTSRYLGWDTFLPLATWGTLAMVLSFIISHGISFAVNYIGQQEYKNISPQQAMMAPYGRVVVMHLVVMGSAFAFASLGANTFSVVIIILLKIVLDFIFHAREHTPKLSYN